DRDGGTQPGERVSDAGRDPFREGVGLGAAGVGKHDNELVASDPGSEIAGAQPLLNRSGDGLQGSIATLVSVGVVDRLEVVQVEQQERERFAVAVGSGDLPLELAAKVPSVGKASEIVGLREEFQF